MIVATLQPHDDDRPLVDEALVEAVGYEPYLAFPARTPYEFATNAWIEPYDKEGVSTDVYLFDVESPRVYDRFSLTLLLGRVEHPTRRQYERRVTNAPHPFAGVLLDSLTRDCVGHATIADLLTIDMRAVLDESSFANMDDSAMESYVRVLTFVNEWYDDMLRHDAASYGDDVINRELFIDSMAPVGWAHLLGRKITWYDAMPIGATLSIYRHEMHDLEVERARVLGGHWASTPDDFRSLLAHVRRLYERTVRDLFADDVGRNAPCPCGSGRKFKNCHMRWTPDDGGPYPWEQTCR